VAAILAYDGLCTFEYGIALELFALPRPELDVPWYASRVVGVDRRRMRGSGGVTVAAEAGLAGLRGAHTIVVPGWRDHREPPPRRLLAALREAADAGARFLTICSGAFVLGHAGLLDGRRATTHWRYIDDLERAFPEVSVDREALYVEDGAVTTSAGSAAGIDAGLAVIRRDFGARVAAVVARRLVMSPHRAGDQPQWVEAPVHARAGRTISGTLDWARRNLHRRIGVAALAAQSAMSGRSFFRHFEAATGTSPLAWLREARLLRARELLEGTALSAAEVARQCGFGSPETFRASFRRALGVSPAAYRRRFSRSRP
jgi:AraC family transcriptional activator FtrA